MGIVNNGLNVMAANMAGSNILISKMAFGEDGTAYNSGNTALGSELKREDIFFQDLSTPGAVIYNTNFTPTEVSGLVAKEFGTFTSGGVMISRDVMTGSFVFTGLQEFSIQQTIQFNISGA